MIKDKTKKVFESYNFIDEQSQIKIRLKRKKDIIQSPWEIGKLIDNLSSYYYKFELINTVSKALNNNIDPKNIFILDESFKINQNYSNLDTMRITDTKIKLLYTIGCPISLYPSKEIFILNIIFKTFRSCNEIIYKFNKKYISKDKISNYTKQYFNEKLSEDEIVKNIVSESIIFIESEKEAHSKIKKRKSITNLRSLETRIIKKIKQYYLDELEMNDIESDLKNFDSNYIKENVLGNTVYNRYYKKFLYLLNRVSRPLVCIFYEESKEIQILGLSHINRRKRKNTFLDIKSISHNSPTLYDFIAGAVNGTCTFLKTKDEIDRNRELHKALLEKTELEKTKLELENLKIKEELEKSVIEKNIKQIELIEKMKEFNDKYGENSAKEIKNPYLKKQFSNAYNNTKSNSQRVLKVNDLEVVDIQEITHIDKRV